MRGKRSLVDIAVNGNIKNRHHSLGSNLETERQLPAVLTTPAHYNTEAMDGFDKTINSDTLFD
jgi:hypothetical protein